MNYCPKCGNKLNENDKFCSNCGYKIESEEVETKEMTGKDFFNSTYTPTPSNEIHTKTHPLAKASFILCFISIGSIALLFILTAISSTIDGSQAVITLFGVLSILFGILAGAASLGTAIPGFIITKKRNYPKPIALAALIIAIIICAVMFFFYCWYEVSHGDYY